MIFFRVDGNKNIGSGHIMRCISIAEAAVEYGFKCLFCLADNSFQYFIEKKGFKCYVLETDYSNPDGELSVLLRLIDRVQPQMVIVDSYYVTESYLLKLHEAAKLIYIDDLGLQGFPVDIVINYNIYGAGIDYESMCRKAGFSVPKLLLGPKYVPLRSEFQKLAHRELRADISNVLVSTGGADSEHVALQLVHALCAEQRLINQYRFHFVIGALNTDYMQLQHLTQGHPNIILHKNVTRMSRLMMQCDIAISAAGSTLYELCACGVPTITYVLADNQRRAEIEFTRKGMMLSVGDIRNNSKFAQDMIACVRELGTNLELRKRLTSNTNRAVNKKGVFCLVEEIIK